MAKGRSVQAETPVVALKALPGKNPKAGAQREARRLAAARQQAIVHLDAMHESLHQLGGVLGLLRGLDAETLQPPDPQDLIFTLDLLSALVGTIKEQYNDAFDALEGVEGGAS